MRMRHVSRRMGDKGLSLRFLCPQALARKTSAVDQSKMYAQGAHRSSTVQIDEAQSPQFETSFQPRLTQSTRVRFESSPYSVLEHQSTAGAPI